MTLYLNFAAVSPVNNELLILFVEISFCECFTNGERFTRGGAAVLFVLFGEKDRVSGCSARPFVRSCNCKGEPKFWEAILDLFSGLLKINTELRSQQEVYKVALRKDLIPSPHL